MSKNDRILNASLYRPSHLSAPLGFDPPPRGTNRPPVFTEPGGGLFVQQPRHLAPAAGRVGQDRTLQARRTGFGVGWQQRNNQTQIIE